MNDNCEYWRAQWDGQLCHLLSSDYQHVSCENKRNSAFSLPIQHSDIFQDCESFAGAINWLDCTEGPESCYAIVEDDCVYSGERVGEDV